MRTGEFWQVWRFAFRHWRHDWTCLWTLALAAVLSGACTLSLVLMHLDAATRNMLERLDQNPLAREILEEFPNTDQARTESELVRWVTEKLQKAGLDQPQFIAPMTSRTARRVSAFWQDQHTDLELRPTGPNDPLLQMAGHHDPINPPNQEDTLLICETAASQLGLPTKLGQFDHAQNLQLRPWSEAQMQTEPSRPYRVIGVVADHGNQSPFALVDISALMFLEQHHSPATHLDKPVDFVGNDDYRFQGFRLVAQHAAELPRIRDALDLGQQNLPPIIEQQVKDLGDVHAFLDDLLRFVATPALALALLFGPLVLVRTQTVMLHRELSQFKHLGFSSAALLAFPMFQFTAIVLATLLLCYMSAVILENWLGAGNIVLVERLTKIIPGTLPLFHIDTVDLSDWLGTGTPLWVGLACLVVSLLAVLWTGWYDIDHLDGSDEGHS
jgi:hypothetical protein